MVVQGVKGNLLELLLSPDKNVQDFMSTLAPGDALRGRVLEILAGENKAIINFKGFNLIAQLPADANIEKGDIINVLISQLNDKVFMKIDPGTIGKGVDPRQATDSTMNSQQLVNVLNELKVPVNEQNIFIAQKLADYHISVTKENIIEVNNAVNKYMEENGIDTRVFNMDTPASARDVLSANFLKLGAELEKAAESLRGMAQIMDSKGQPTAVGQVETQNIARGMAIKAMNIIDTINTAAGAAPGAGLSLQDDGITLTFNNPGNGGAAQANAANGTTQADTARAVINAALNEGLIEKDTAESLTNTFNAAVTQGADIKPEAALGANAILTLRQNGILELKYRGVPQLIETITSGAASQQAGDLRQALESGLFAAKTEAAQAPSQKDIINLLTTDGKALVIQARDVFAAINKNVFVPQNTNLQDNFKQTASLLTSLNDSMKDLTNQFESTAPKTAGTATMAINDFKTGVLKVMDGINNVFKQLGMPEEMLKTGTDTGGNTQALKTGGSSQGQAQDIKNAAGADYLDDLTIQPQDYAKYQSVMKDFMLKAGDTPALKPPPQISAADATPGQSKLPVDTESTIEAVAFLKSRNLPVENTYVDTMSRYFNNDMKLSQNLEQFNHVSGILESSLKGARAQAVDVPVRAVMQTVTDIKRVVQDISIKTQDSNLKAGLLESQLKAFIDRSGLNLENRLAMQVKSDAAKGTAQGASQDTQLITKDNLKSLAIKLSEQIAETDTSRMTSAQRDAVRQVRDAANDILTNINALQFMNHKPVSFDMVYSQIPVYFNQKLFNGELQVWYRKGALKEDLKSNTPINMVFMLNTSNLGPVKVSMSVYRNEIQCNIRAESDKAKQMLVRGKNEFVDNMKKINYDIKVFDVRVEDAGQVQPPSPGEGYVNLGNINLQA
jgi:hypothetical protein